MPLRDDLDDDREIVEAKFDGCETCKNCFKPRTCRACDSGEFYEERDPAGVDSMFFR